LVFVLPSQGDRWKLLNTIFLETPKAVISQLCRKQPSSHRATGDAVTQELCFYRMKGRVAVLTNQELGSAN